MASAAVKATEKGEWNWSEVDALEYSSSPQKTTGAWLDHSSLLTSIYANLDRHWIKSTRRNYKYLLKDTPRKGDPILVPGHSLDSFSRCLITTYLLSWPERLRTREEARRLFLAILSSGSHAEFLHLATYGAHKGWYSHRLWITWPLIVEYWRRRYPSGFVVRPRQHRLQLYQEDCYNVARFWNLRHGVRSLMEPIRRWLMDVALHPRPFPFRAPHWASLDLYHMIHGVTPDVASFRPTAATIDQVEINIARLLTICACYALPQPPHLRQYEYMYQHMIACIHKAFRSMAWYNFASS